MSLKFILEGDAKPPTKHTKLSAGYDLFSSEPYLLEPKAIVRVKTGLRLSFPSGCYGQILDRSSKALKGFHCLSGVIDPDYVGCIEIILVNLTDYPIIISQHEKIAQIICIKIAQPDLEQVNSLDSTERDEEGFGSSDK